MGKCKLTVLTTGARTAEFRRGKVALMGRKPCACGCGKPTSQDTEWLVMLGSLDTDVGQHGLRKSGPVGASPGKGWELQLETRPPSLHPGLPPLPN